MHSHPTTPLQFRRNHFSVQAPSVNRAGLKAGAIGSMALPVTTCPPAPAGVLR
ncbi:hypothetical protein C7S16_5715 [Burkholderia thailandensis]|uniref:Uncharacterized protein n=1 Tax=Burkholderia thailandensis TaxID=57975 RepID=A0AAW9CSQ6_BURTH|nr:hypothetical protein [Burkholderia thailandensis]MDW9252646.1 hypothetical protein [Burkholderia thailandensis]